MEKRDNNKAINDVRLGQQTRVRNVIRYCNSIIKEKNLREVKFSAVGGAIGKLVSTVEVLRIVNPGFHQVSKIGTVSYQTVDSSGSVTTQRLYPKLEVTLSLDEPSNKNDEGYQAPLNEEERLKLFELHSKRIGGEERPSEGTRQGRGAPRGRVGRGGRGQRGGPRGGFNGQRGAPRGGFRGQRGAPRGRGGFANGPRNDSFRGQRGAPRGRGRGRGQY